MLPGSQRRLRPFQRADSQELTDGQEVAMSGPLAGCKVLDLSWGVAGPFATMFMADNGADVIRIEPPGGDPYRDLLPAYRVWQRGKQSLTLNLKTDSDRRILHELLDGADVLIESFGPGVTDRLG